MSCNFCFISAIASRWADTRALALQVSLLDSGWSVREAKLEKIMRLRIPRLQLFNHQTLGSYGKIGNLQYSILVEVVWLDVYHVASLRSNSSSI